MLHVATLLLAAATIAPVTAPPIPIELGHETARLNGPWQFHAGDDPAWASPAFDDSAWERVDLTAPKGAHDGDVGLSGFVKGWGARGHRGLGGYGWYRLHLHLLSPQDQALALAGPPAVDSAYQVFWNGQLLGSAGDFRRRTPVAFSIRPSVYAIPPSTSSDDVLAIRVWMGPWELADPSAGGIRIAPTLGTERAIREVAQTEWIETLRGYIVEVLEAIGFAACCIGVWLLAAFRVPPKHHAWLYAALLLTAACRLNQAIFFWGQFESVPFFLILSPCLLYPLALAAWTAAWAGEARFQRAWWWRAFVAVTAIYLAAQLGQRAMTHAAALAIMARVCRGAFLAATLCCLAKIALSQRRHRWLLALMMLAISVGQFASELSQLGVPGIWFPLGTGVSRAQFAYAFFFVFAAVFFCLRLREIAAATRRSAAA